MSTLEQNQVFEKFLTEYGDRYAQVRGIARLLDSNRELCRLFKEFEPIAVEKLDAQQSGYLWLLDHLENPIEKKFFKRCWVPLGNEEHDFFIDLSSENYSLFSTNYFFFAPYRWFRQTLVHDIRTLLNANCTEDLEESLRNFEKEFWIESKKCFRAHWLFGWHGHIKPKRMTIKQLCRSRKMLFWHYDGHQLVVTGAEAGIVSLLPSRLAIKVTSWNLTGSTENQLAAEQTTVAGFCFLIQSRRIESFDFYKISFHDNNSTAIFDATQRPTRFVVEHPDQAFIERILVRLKRLNPNHPM